MGEGAEGDNSGGGGEGAEMISVATPTLSTVSTATPRSVESSVGVNDPTASARVRAAMGVAVVMRAVTRTLPALTLS